MKAAATKAILAVRARWRRSPRAEAVASVCASASCYRLLENVFVIAIVISELELCDVKRQIFFAYLVIAADDPAFEQRPKTFNRVRMNCADDILAFGVIDRLVRINLVQAVIRVELVGNQKAHFVRNGLLHECDKVLCVHVIDDAGDHVALARYRAGNRRFLGCATERARPRRTFARLAANIGLVNFDDPHKLAEILVLKRRANAMAHIPSRLVRAEAHVALYLPRTDALLTCQHKMNDLEPIAQLQISIFEDRANEVREPISIALSALGAFPLKRHLLKGIDFVRTAARAANSARPASGDQKAVASLFVREKLVELLATKLLNLSGHWFPSDYPKSSISPPIRQVRDHRLQSYTVCARIEQN